jgi:hypothetical protein
MKHDSFVEYSFIYIYVYVCVSRLRCKRHTIQCRVRAHIYIYIIIKLVSNVTSVLSTDKKLFFYFDFCRVWNLSLF